MEGSVRLQGGSNNTHGRVEVCISNIWGTVCNDSWNKTDADVACAQLGFSSGIVATVSVYIHAYMHTHRYCVELWVHQWNQSDLAEQCSVWWQGD